MSIFSKSKKLNFNNLTSENECKKEKLTGNLKDHLKFYHHELSKQNEIYWSTGNSLLQEKSNVNKDDYEIVECIDFVEFINSLVSKENQIDLIKIDIEGAEVELINYIIDSGSIDNIKQIICEVHDKKYKFLSEKTNLLRQKIIDNNLSDKINLDWK